MLFPHLFDAVGDAFKSLPDVGQTSLDKLGYRELALLSFYQLGVKILLQSFKLLADGCRRDVQLVSCFAYALVTDDGIKGTQCFKRGDSQGF